MNESDMPEFDEDDDEAEAEGDESEDEGQVELEKKAPTLPAKLYYDSKSHGVRRYYVSARDDGGWKPRWTENEAEAFVFNDLDHLYLAGQYCKHRQYYQMKIGSVELQLA